MIPSPFGWTIEVLPSGMAFAHPQGPTTASIVYRDRARPLRRLGTLVREFLGTLSAFHATAVGTPERLLTREGEHAALVTITGTQDGAPVQRDLGFVFADDFYSVTSGLCHDPTMFPKITDLVRALIRDETQVLGLRRRRFEYTPPPNWQPLVRSGLAVEWIAPGYPRDTTSMFVYAANPVALVSQSIESMIATLAQVGFHVAAEQPPQELVIGRLAGHHQSVLATREGTAPMLREVVLLADARYRYAFELTSHTAERWPDARAALRALLETVREVPGLGQHAPPSAALTHWSE